MARGLKEEKRECRACRGWGKVQSVVFWVPLFVLLWQEAQPRTWSLSSRQAGKGVGHAGGAAKGMSFEYYTPSISENVLLAEGRRFLEAQTLEVLCTSFNLLHLLSSLFLHVLVHSHFICLIPLLSFMFPGSPCLPWIPRMDSWLPTA